MGRFVESAANRASIAGNPKQRQTGQHNSSLSHKQHSTDVGCAHRRTLPSNLALCVNPDFTYVRVRNPANGRVYIVAESRLAAVPGAVPKAGKRGGGGGGDGKKGAADAKGGEEKGAAAPKEAAAEQPTKGWQVGPYLALSQETVQTVVARGKLPGAEVRCALQSVSHYIRDHLYSYNMVTHYISHCCIISCLCMIS